MTRRADPDSGAAATDSLVWGKWMARPERILIVDDDARTAEFIAELLRAQGYETDWAFDGQEALAKLRGTSPEAAGVETAFDLMVLDVMIPGIDGYEVCRRVKSDESLRHISVVMVTGLGSTTNKTKGLELGADDYVTKPFTPEELLARVKAGLRVRAMEREVVQRNRELAALNTISRLTSRSLNLEDVLSTTLSQALTLLAGRAALIALVEGEDEPGTEQPSPRTRAGTRHPAGTRPLAGGSRPREVVLRMHRGLPPQLAGQMGEARWALGHGLIGEVVAQGETRVSTELSDDPHLRLLPDHGLHAVACAPLTAQHGVVGVLAVFNRDRTLWGEHSLRLLEAAGGQVGVAVDNARLYTRVSRYAEQLARSQEQLIQAEKLAAMGRLTASIAHELNNPLQAIQNCLHLILRRPPGDKKREQYLDMARDEVERLIKTVQGMLDFYRPSSEQQHATDIHQAIEDVLALASKRLERGQVRVLKAYDPGLPYLNAAENQLKQVFLNLVINAVEAMPDGGELRIQTRISEDREWLVIAFQDQGIGLSRNAMIHLFEPFYTTKNTGTGLGLSISYGIAEQHGGTIEVDSEQGRGSCFTVKLPTTRAVTPDGTNLQTARTRMRARI
jgi:signal transduction histidine kinase/DNA-binding response OmpR family regulator